MANENINGNAQAEAAEPKKNRVFIGPEYVIVKLIKADKKKYLTISRLFHFVIYLQQQLSEKAGLFPESEVIFDISFNSIERTVRYNNKAFDLIGDTIIVKGDLPPITENVPKFLPEYIDKFAEKFAA